MSKILDLNQQSEALITTAATAAEPNPPGVQFESFIPKVTKPTPTNAGDYVPGPGGTKIRPPLAGAKGASQGTPGDSPAGLPKWTFFTPDPNQRYLVNKDGQPTNRRPRCMGDVTGGMDPTPLPDGTDPDLGNSLGLLDGVAGIDRHYETHFRIDYLMPKSVVNDKNGVPTTYYPYNIPSVMIAWHGEAGVDDEDVPPVHPTSGLPIRPKANSNGHPNIQFQFQRVAKNGKMSLWVRLLGGRSQNVRQTFYVMDGAGNYVLNADGSKKTQVIELDPPDWYDPIEGGISSGDNYVEFDREIDCFPDALEMPTHRRHHLRWHNQWHWDTTLGKFQVWLNDVLVVDLQNAATIYKEPSGHEQTPAHSEWGYYRPQEGEGSSFHYPEVWTEGHWMTGIMIASQESDLYGSGGPGGPGGGGADPPINNVAPVITALGGTRVGSVLGVNVGDWTGVETFGYQWVADGVPIPAATGPTFALTEAEDGANVACDLTGTNIEDESVTVRTASVLVLPALPVIEQLTKGFWGIPA